MKMSTVLMIILPNNYTARDFSQRHYFNALSMLKIYWRDDAINGEDIYFFAFSNQQIVFIKI